MIRARLIEIDAPEKKQPFGARSRWSLAVMSVSKVARVEGRGHDCYSRIPRRMYCEGMYVNAEHLRRIFAWVYERCAAENSYLDAI